MVGNGEHRETASGWADSLAVEFPSPGGSQEMGSIVVFVTVEQLRRHGVLPIRAWVEHRFPQNRRLTPCKVVAFEPFRHQEAFLDAGSSSGSGS